MRLLFITQKVDRSDWLLGFTHGWLKELSSRVEQLTVICLEQGETELPANVRVISLGKEHGVGRAVRAWGLLQAVAANIGRVDGVFAHMSPAFAIAAAPFAQLRGIPLVLWYTHRHVDAKLRLATWLSGAIATASPESFQLASSKVNVLGHGIDPEQFLPQPEAGQGDVKLLLGVGRLSPIKRYELLIEATRILQLRHFPIHTAIAGDDPPGDSSYGDEIRGMSMGRVEFLGAVPHAQIAAWYHRCAVAVNLCPTGGLDKTVLEAMFCAKPVLVTNRSFAPLLGTEGQHWLVGETGNEVISGLIELLNDPTSGARAGAIRTRALAAHSLPGLMDRLLALFTQLRSH
jgi:glycosyltransferase involved in cell wall biosynthesis